MGSWMGEGEAERERDVALICVAGHVVNPRSLGNREFNTKFCGSCGRPTVSKCAACNTPIPGAMRGVYMPSQRYRKAYCGNCGAAYPWTKYAADQVFELAVESGQISQEDCKTLVDSVPELLVDSPGTAVAVVRFKRIVSKGGQVVADGAKQILIEIVCEAARRLIWGPKA